MDEDKTKQESLGGTPENQNPEVLTNPEAGQEIKPETPAGDMLAEKDLRQKIENIHLDPNLTQPAKAHADDISGLEEKEKLEKLMKLTKEKGVVYAINVAKRMNDPYILDTLHDVLAKEGYYKEFLK